MMNFLPISILAYALNGGAVLIDKILLRTGIPNPFVYTFYIGMLQFFVVIFIPFGFHFSPYAAFLSILSGIIFISGLLPFFLSLKKSDASVVGPITGSLNPAFALIIGWFLLDQILTGIQLIAFFVILLGTLILTFNLWFSRLRFNNQLLLMCASGFLFGLSYVFLREAFLLSNFISVLVISKLATGSVALLFLISPAIRKQIFVSRKELGAAKFINKTFLLLLFGQSMGAGFGLLVNYAVSLASPALVNSLFGIQYLVILAAALILGKKHPQLLDENLSKGAVAQKIAGAGFLSLGVYLLSK